MIRQPKMTDWHMRALAAEILSEYDMISATTARIPNVNDLVGTIRRYVLEETSEAEIAGGKI